MEPLNQKSEIQELTILNQQDVNDEIEQHFHTAKYTSSFKWQGVPIASKAREIILLLQSQEKFWTFSKDSFESLYYSNSNLTLEVSHKVNNANIFAQKLIYYSKLGVTLGFTRGTQDIHSLKRK